MLNFGLGRYCRTVWRGLARMLVYSARLIRSTESTRCGLIPRSMHRESCFGILGSRYTRQGRTQQQYSEPKEIRKQPQIHFAENQTVALLCQNLERAVITLRQIQPTRVFWKCQKMNRGMLPTTTGRRLHENTSE